jgi:DNA primase
MSNIDEIKQRIDIVELISDYVSLQKAGRNFKALCPFHQEKHSSFFVFPEQQTWHCFGACGTGGDVFSFIMKKEGISFSEALQLLASRAGITLSQDKTTADKVEDKRRQRLFQLNEAASEYYHHLLLNTSAGERARNYLNKRNVSMETAKEFHLGFSPDSWDASMKFLTSKGYEDQELKDAGLIIERETGGSYDRFRNHLMFPIHNIQGQVTGFGARTMDESLPKYINSPQTLVFDKGNSIYGIDKANPFIKKEGLVIIMEGYMDVLTAHQHGWQNSVAAMGTSLTENQVAIVRKLSKNIALALDADAAGEQATLRSTEVVARFIDKAEVTVIAMPPGKDPDDVISGDPELWRKLMGEGLPIFDFALETVTKQVDKGNAKEKSIAVQKLLPLIHEIKDPIQQSHYERKLARKLDIEEMAKW